jgi:hypothetical protein
MYVYGIFLKYVYMSIKDIFFILKKFCFFFFLEKPVKCEANEGKKNKSVIAYYKLYYYY